MRYRSGQTIAYATFADDVVESSDQGYTLDPAYDWSEVGSASAFEEGLYAAVCRIYCFGLKRIRFVDARTVRPEGGSFVFANHTQPVADALILPRAAAPHRPFAIVTPANLGIPVLGRILPRFGALPIPHTIHGMRRFDEAVLSRAAEGCAVFVYPEAHVWPYYTGIRPVKDTSFSYPVRANLPAYCMTTTYRTPRRAGGKPRIVTYLDGPFHAAPEAAAQGRRAARADLCSQVMVCMRKRAATSDYQYVRYVQRAGEEG